MSVIDTSCPMCEHFNREKYGTCKAYPDGIPFEIVSSEVSHDKPLPDQEGQFVFEPRKKGRSRFRIV